MRSGAVQIMVKERFEAGQLFSVSPELFKNALDVFASDATVNSVPLYLHLASVVQLPSKCSRHNTPTQAHALTKAVSKNVSGNDEAFVVILRPNRNRNESNPDPVRERTRSILNNLHFH